MHPQTRRQKTEGRTQKNGLLLLLSLSFYLLPFPLHPSLFFFLPATAQTRQDRKAEADRLLQQGIQQYQAEQFTAALESWQQALTIYQEIKDRRGEGDALINLGLAHFSLGNYAKAVEVQQQSLVIAREIKDRPREGDALINLGGTYFSLGNYAKAIEVQQQDLAIAREIKDRPREGNALGNLSLAHFSLGNYAKVIEFEQQHLVIAREIKDRPREGQSLGQLGEAYFFLGNYAKAIEVQQQSLAIAREIKNRDREGQSLDNLGDAYLSLGNYAKAIEFYQQSLAIWRELERFLAETYSLNHLGNALFKSGDLPAAAKTLMTGITTWEQLRPTEAWNDPQKVLIFGFQARTYRTLQQVLIAQNLPNEALEIAERGRARVFVELLAQRLTVRRPGVAVPPPAAIAPPNLQQIQQIAQAQGATLVQYSIIYDNSKLRREEKTSEVALYIWVISPTGAVTFRQADLKFLWQEQNTSLSNLVEQSREVIGARGRADVEVALSPEFLKRQQEQQTHNLKQLHQILIEPVVDLLPQDPNQRVIFLPQDALFLVPFPALLDANNKPLIEKHTILTAPSIQVLELTRKQRDLLASRNSANNKLLIVGNPIMPKVVMREGDPPVQLSNLPGAKQEALEIAKLFNTQAMIGAQATKNAIAQQMPNARIIHLATHGLLDDTRGLMGIPGAIALAPSGNGQLNDGLLTSNEILDMKLNAELVVLSACDTGRGRITGDGVIGLSRSLFTAGVPSIIVSLWKVPDDSTTFLMTEFYKNLNTTSDKAQALRQAMLTTKQKYPEPLNWAAFTLIGEAE